MPLDWLLWVIMLTAFAVMSHYARYRSLSWVMSIIVLIGEAHENAG